LHEAEEDFREIKCKNGLWDIAMPIVIDGRMVATFFIGQFFYDDEKVDETFFRAQAAEFDFDEASYLAALKKVPVFSREQIRNILDFYRDLIQVLADSGLKKLKLVQEVKERNNVEKVLVAREQEYRSLAESSPDHIVRYDRKGRILYLNKALVRHLELSTADEVIGKKPREVRLDGCFASIEQAADRAMETGVIQTVEASAPGTEGSVTTDQILIVPERNVAGKIIGAIAFGRDITEGKRMKTELQNKNRELESFTYTVSHDLKSPLITIRGFAGAIIEDLAARRNDRIEKDLQRISNAADKMMTLLDDLLQLSRIGRVINPPEPVDMTCLAKEIVDNLTTILDEDNVKVSVQPDLPTVSCDRQRILEVLQNLIENAVQYRGRQPELRIQVGLREEGGRPVFFVRDNGVGIASQYHQHIFGQFNRLDAQIPGNGIGLSLVKRIIEEHGGRVWVESEGEGTGSTFCFSLNCPAFKEGERLQ
jgi:PAS domain S-box-containing protein